MFSYITLLLCFLTLLYCHVFLYSSTIMFSYITLLSCFLKLLYCHVFLYNLQELLISSGSLWEGYAKEEQTSVYQESTINRYSSGLYL